MVLKHECECHTDPSECQAVSQDGQEIRQYSTGTAGGTRRLVGAKKLGHKSFKSTVWKKYHICYGS